MRNAMRLGAVIALGASAALGACGGNKGDASAGGAGNSATATNDAAGSATASSGATSGNTAATPPGPPAGAGGATTPADSVKSGDGSTARMTDPEIVTLTQASDEGEIMTSKIALTKATNPAVRQYAQQLINAHTQLISKRNALSKAQNLKPAAGAKDSIGDAGRKMVAMLQAAPKAAFDTAYVNGQVMSHTNTLQMIQKAEGQAQNAALKQMLQQAAPDIQRHLDEAKSLQGKLAGGAAGGAGSTGAAQ